MATFAHSGYARVPGPGEWFDGWGFWLNEISGEETRLDDDRLSEDFSHLTLEECQEAYYEMRLDHPQCIYPQETLNNGTLRLEDLNMQPELLEAALLTSFDLPDEVDWLAERLQLRRDVRLTICSHAWEDTLPAAHRRRMLADYDAAFDDVLVFFPGGQASTGQSVEEPDSQDRASCSVHAKLLLLQFQDRLRVGITSANLCHKHWDLRNEVVWVQDFPRASSCSPFALLTGRLGDFGARLGHFVADLLDGAPQGRAESWIEALASCDFRKAAGHLILSGPGYFPQVQRDMSDVPLGADGFTLHLEADVDKSWHEGQEAEHDVLQAHGVAKLKRADGGEWTLHAQDSNKSLARLRRRSCLVLQALESSGGWSIPEQCHLLAFDGQSSVVDDSADTENAGHSDASASTYRQVRVRIWRDTSNGRQAGHQDDEEEAGEGGGQGNNQAVELVVLLLRFLALNKGLLALQEVLEQHAWPAAEEQFFAAITSSISTWDDSWLRTFDVAAGRLSPEGCAGPSIVAPRGPLADPWTSHAYSGSLVDHTAPEHAPGRELAPNHSKMLVRQFRDSESGELFGWAYAGSHNLTVSAWGCRRREDADQGVCDHVWLGNRELGIVLVEPPVHRTAGNDEEEAIARANENLFARVPLPWGLPLQPVDVTTREFLEREDAMEDGEDSSMWKWNSNEYYDSSWYWQNYWWYDSGSYTDPACDCSWT